MQAEKIANRTWKHITIIVPAVVKSFNANADELTK